MVLLGTGIAAAQPAPAALDKPPFSATAAELLAVAKTAGATAEWPVVVLRDDDELNLDTNGRAHQRWRRVFVITSQAGVDDWGTWGAQWSPFYQDKPTVRARVIEPDGTVVELDPKLVVDAPVSQRSATVFSDRRTLEAPLPRLRIGAVVEEEMILDDRAPALAAGDRYVFWVGDTVPTRSTRITLAAPAGRRAHQTAHNLPGGAKPRHEVTGGREVWTFAFGALPPNRSRDLFAPSDVSVEPYIALSSAASWSAVAREYRKLIDAQLAAKPYALPAELPRTPTIETIRAITSWLHRKIRYTGIEFGQAAYIPWPPADTVARGFGDCKDKAALLVALLRQAGIRADLALLSDGPGVDVPRDQPGVDMFDHAIVRARVAGRDVWIDATEDLVAPGRLPSRDQGRLALVIADDATDLVMTPSAPAADNTIREVRTFELAEQGSATRVTEVSRETGAFEAATRAWLRDTPAQDVRKQLTSYVASEYEGAKLERYTSTPADDLATPLELTVAATDADRARTERGKIDIELHPSDTLEKVPELVSDEPDKGNDPRRDDFVWYQPHVYEIENRFVLPPGFAAPTDPIKRERALGPAKFVETRRLDGTTLVVTFQFESGKPRLSPTELATLQRELHALSNESVHIVIEQTGWNLATQGRYRDAIAEIERLVRLHPKEALHLTQLAFVYIQAGMGDAARRVARQATTLEPKNADAQVILGWVLTHDLFGRRYAPGHDRAGALAAFVRAHALDPKHVGATTEYADLLARGASGMPYDRGCDLKAAAEAWRVARMLADSPAHRLSHARVMLVAGDLGGAEALLRDMAPEQARDELLVATVAAGKGGARAAVAAAAGLRSGADKQALLEKVARVLLVYRYFDAMRALLSELGPQSQLAQYTTAFQKLQRLDKVASPGSDPRAAVNELLHIPIDPAFVTSAFWDAQTDKELRPTLVFHGLQLPEVTTQLMFEASVAVAEVRVDGAPAAWRVALEAMGQKSELYVALDRGAAKVIGSELAPAGAGRHALRLIARRDLASTNRLLDWVRSDLGTKTQRAHSFAAMWTVGAPHDAAATTLAAACLAGGDPAAVPILIKCESADPDARSNCDEALADNYLERDQWRELEAHTAAWMNRKPHPVVTPYLRAVALYRLGKLDDADKLLDGLVTAHADFSPAHRLRSAIAFARGNVAEGIKRLDPMIQHADASAYNDVAWSYVTHEQDLKIALDLAHKAVGPDKSRASAHVLNTLALVELEAGDLGAAKADEWASLGRRHGAALDSADWYVVGRLAEQLGLRDDAIALYRKISVEPVNPGEPTSFELAQKRLKALGVK
jgi:transglutaminase-like putative cysteine protease/tetratricopeptide (TPR) repeat protein